MEQNQLIADALQDIVNTLKCMEKSLKDIEISIKDIETNQSSKSEREYYRERGFIQTYA